jgi:putative ATP-dependent endonuclease of OLD family
MMRIAQLEIRNFRSIPNATLDLPALCALVGPNNSGKSNLLLALSRVFGRAWVNAQSFDDEMDRFQRDSDRDVVIKVTFDAPIQYQRFKAGPSVDIASLEFKLTRYKRGEKSGEPRVEQRCLDAKGTPVRVPRQALKPGEQAKFEPMSGAIPREVMERVPLIYIDTRRSLRDAMPTSRYSLLRQLMNDIDEDFQAPEQVVTVPRPTGETETMSRAERWHQLMRAAMDLLRTPAFEDLERDINESALRQLGFNPHTEADQLQFFFSPKQSLDFYRALELQVNDAGFEVSASDLGEGFQNAVVLAILEAFEKRRKRGAILLIEEPEMFLHPHTQRSLFKTLLSISAENQVIYTTHSPQMIHAPSFDHVLLFRRAKGATTIRSSSLSNDEKRRHALERAFDPTRNELFFSRRVLIVEGDTERLSLPQWAKKLDLDLDYAGASIVEVGGKNNLLLFAEIAASFGIPTGILYDCDSSDIDAKQNAKLNDQLEKFNDPDVEKLSWRLNAKYEDELRGEIGEERYQGLCQRYPAMSKPQRQRQIAADPSVEAPAFVRPILNWLAGKLPEEVHRS